MNDTILTSVWEGDLKGEPTKLVHIPNYGKFHRLVIATPYLGWSNACIVRIGDITIRFTEGEIHGEKIEPLDQVEVEGKQVRITGRGSGSATAKGRFIEIVAPADSLEAAELFSYSIAGLLALCFGPQAVGEVIFSEPYDASADHQSGVMKIPVMAKFPRLAESTEIETVHLLLPHLIGGAKAQRSRVLALTWYERGIRMDAPVDRLLAHFIGIETLVNSFTALNGPVPEATEREKQFDGLISEIRSQFAAETAALVRQRLIEPSLAERFGFYVDRHSLQKDLKVTFSRLARLRNDALHGSPADVGQEDARDAGRLLLRLLKTELGLLGDMSWERTPRIDSLAVEYEVVRDQSMTTDSRPRSFQPPDAPDVGVAGDGVADSSA